MINEVGTEGRSEEGQPFTDVTDDAGTQVIFRIPGYKKPIRMYWVALNQATCHVRSGDASTDQVPRWLLDQNNIIVTGLSF